MSATMQIELHSVARPESTPPSRASSLRHETDKIDEASVGQERALSFHDEDDTPLASPLPTNVVTAVPEGGYGWVVVGSCSLFTFWFNGISGSWGVIQASLLQSELRATPTSTISFVGTLGLASIVAFGLLGVRLLRLLGARITAFLGVILLALGEIFSSLTTSNISGLFGTSGVVFGLGACLCYSLSNTIPTQYFAARLGLASGLVKLGGGIGAAVLSIAIEAMIRSTGIEWTFRILGFCILASGLPAAWFVRERVPVGPSPFIDLAMFRHITFTAVFCAGAIGTFALFVPPFFLPIFAQSMGLSSATGAALAAGFNACTAVGRFFSGWMSDSIGPVNMFLITMSLNAVSMLAIWPVSESLAPLVIFAMLNGLANGAFFTLYPVVVATTSASINHGRGSGPEVAMSMATTGWTGGYLLGVPIAGYLLQASGTGAGAGAGGAATSHAGGSISIGPYRPAIFYAGGVAVCSAAFVLLARLKMGGSGKKRE